MKILFIHQGFPGQFKHLAPALAAMPGNQVVALKLVFDASPRDYVAEEIQVKTYKVARGSTKGIHPWVGDFESKVIRAEACYEKAKELRNAGYYPDVIVAHHGWGESLFLKQVWPQAKLGLFCEYYYRSQGSDVDFDPEFASESLASPCRLQLKNANNDLHFNLADGAISPTWFQANTFPASFRPQIAVVHDGIDTARLKPTPDAVFEWNALRFSRQDEVITFVNRNLEPARGYHRFMRALPQLLAARPNARVVIVGGDGVSYGAKPDAGKSWKTIFIDEVRQQITDADWSRVHFVGQIPYPTFIALLQVSSVHVYLTYPFVLSWSLIEAMSLGCAIVASDTAPVREVIVDGETGCLVDFFDHDHLAHQICVLLDDPDRRSKLGMRARSEAVAKYDLQQVCLPQQIEWVYRLAAAGARSMATAAQQPPVLNVVAVGQKKVAGVTEARIDYPLSALNELPGVHCRWAEENIRISAQTAPGIFVLHRRFLNDAKVVAATEQLAAAGWVLVSDMDDDPYYWREFADSDFFAFRGVHAVTVSTEPLRTLIAQWNPHVAVFANAVFRLPQWPNSLPKQGERLRIFFGAFNRQADWKAVEAGIIGAARLLADRVEFVVVHDRPFFDALPGDCKQFHNTLNHHDYLALLASCDINLLPLADTSFNRLKSDLKFIESCAAGAVPICSPVVYGDNPDAVKVALFATSPQQWGESLIRLCHSPGELSERRQLGLDYVKAKRMHHHQAQTRKDYYLSLWLNREVLEAERQARIKQMRRQEPGYGG